MSDPDERSRAAQCLRLGTPAVGSAFLRGSALHKVEVYNGCLLVKA